MKVEIKKTKYKGFSLMEMIVAIFVFSLIMTTMMATFVSITKSRKKTKAIQQDIEDARYTMELMAKTLRTSGISSPNAVNASDIQAYDYSQGLCVEYKFNSATHKLQYWSGAPGTVDDMATCSWPTSGDLIDMTNGNMNEAHFVIVKTEATPTPVIGKITLAFKICYNNNCDITGDTAIIQTTISLRDYSEVNP